MSANDVIYECNYHLPRMKPLLMKKQSRRTLTLTGNILLKIIAMQKMNQVMQILIQTRISMAVLLIMLTMLKATPIVLMTTMMNLQMGSLRLMSLF